MCKSFAFLFALSWVGWWLTPDQEGWRSFRNEEFTKAAGEFANPMWRQMEKAATHLICILTLRLVCWPVP